MKLVKLSVFALAMGLCVASCGGSTEEAPATTDTTVVEAPVEAAPVVADTATTVTDTTVHTDSVAH